MNASLITNTHHLTATTLSGAAVPITQGRQAANLNFQTMKKTITFFKKPFAALALAVLLFFVAGMQQVQAQNFITNSNLNGTPSPGDKNTGQAPTSWSLLLGTNDLPMPGTTRNVFSNPGADQFLQYNNANPSANASCGGGSVVGGGVGERFGQPISGLTIGQTYTIYFEQANVGLSSGLNGQGDWQVTGPFTTVFAPSMPAATPSNTLPITWSKVKLTFTATATSGTLGFGANLGGPGSGLSYILIDNIYLVPSGATTLGDASANACFAGLLPCSITLATAGSNSQTVTAGTAITPIVYNTTGAAGAAGTGLPAGVTGTFSGSTYTISGTPTTAGTNNYTVTATGGTCSGITATGTITVNAVIPPVTANNPPAQTATTNQPKTGNAATELAPAGGVGAYVYSNGSGDPACTNPGSAMALPAGSNLTVTGSTGAYTYTAPTTVGTYYFCIKVCDTATPTASCTVKTYTVTVTATPPPCNANTVPALIKNP